MLAAAHIAKMPLDRGYGVKPNFFGDAPFLELLGGVVVGGEVAVLKAIALVSIIPLTHKPRRGGCRLLTLTPPSVLPCTCPLSMSMKW